MAKYGSRTLRVTANRLSNGQGQTRRFRPQCANRRFVGFVSAIKASSIAVVGGKISEPYSPLPSPPSPSGGGCGRLPLRGRLRRGPPRHHPYGATPPHPGAGRETHNRKALPEIGVLPPDFPYGKGGCRGVGTGGGGGRRGVQGYGGRVLIQKGRGVGGFQMNHRGEF